MSRPSKARRLFAERVRAMRILRHLTQEQLAERMNVHRTYIGSIERMEVNITVDNMQRFADALKCELRELL